MTRRGGWARTWRRWLRERGPALGDAIVRWARLPETATGGRRRLVVIQVCGLSHELLVQAVERGRMPGVARLVRRGWLRVHRVPASLPTSTPAYQAAVMYGGPVDVPAFEFVDKRTGAYLWFPRPWDAARVEAAHAQGRHGIVRGGRTYGCVFGGGAADTVLTFAHLLRPGPLPGHIGFRARVVPLLILAWVVAKMSVVTADRLLRWAAAALRSFVLGAAVAPLRWPLTRLLVSGWLRELFTLGAIADVYAGIPVLYVNFVDYDVAAHALGPTHPESFRALRAVDRSIRQIARAVRRAAIWRHDLFVVSDHGQLHSVPVEAVTGGISAVEVVLRAFGPGPAPAGPGDPGPAPGGDAGADSGPPMPLWPFGPRWQRELEFSPRRARRRNAVWAGGLCVVPAGPNINVYLVHRPDRVLVEEIEARYPGALQRLSGHPAVGFVLARDAAGGVCYHRGKVLRIPPEPGSTGCPLFDRPDRPVVVRGLLDLLAMPSGGDVIVYGHYADVGCVNYLNERGSHAGPTEAELYPFVLAPPDLPFDFGAVTGPRDLHPLFAGYQADPVRGGDA